MKRVLFIINPISGGGKAKRFSKYLKTNKSALDMNFDIIYTKTIKTVQENLNELDLDNWDIIVAAGGDGTVNETATAIINKNIYLGIIPLGSGNGLARHLNIPINYVNALKKLLNGRPREIDIGFFNSKPFINMAGIGFDGFVAGLFSGSEKRGLKTYARCVYNGLKGYKAKKYILNIDGKDYEHEAFIIAFANSKQYGNNFFIAPNSSLDDGVIDITVINKVPLINIPRLILAMKTRNLNKLNYVHLYKGRNIKVYDLENEPAHHDGEHLVVDGNLNINVKSNQIRVVI